MPAEDIVLLPTLLTETGTMHHVPCATHPIAGVQEESKADQGEFALCQEGKCTHPWQPANGIMSGWGKMVPLARLALIYLKTCCLVGHAKNYRGRALSNFEKPLTWRAFPSTDLEDVRDCRLSWRELSFSSTNGISSGLLTRTSMSFTRK